jgi:porin
MFQRAIRALTITISGLFLLGILCSAQENNKTDLPSVGVPTGTSEADSNRAADPKTAQAVPVPVAPPSVLRNFGKMAELNKKFDETKLRGLSLDPPQVGDSVLGDIGGWRSALLKYKIGFTSLDLHEFDYNLLRAPMRGAIADPDGHTRQIFLGQRPTVGGPENLILTYSPSSNTQFAVGGVFSDATWAQMNAAVGPGVMQLTLTQDFLKHRAQVLAGYMDNSLLYYMGFTGGVIGAGTLGQNAILSYAVGESHGVLEQRPTVDVRFHWTPHVYTLTGWQKSTSPEGSSTERQHDHLGLRWNLPNAGDVALGEVGYRRESAPDAMKTFIRFSGLYNTSGYTDYRSGSLALITGTAKKTDNNWWISAAGDQQLTQPDKMLPFRGLYQGATLQYIPPQQNVLTKYFEYRGYYIGRFTAVRLKVEQNQLVANIV